MNTDGYTKCPNDLLRNPDITAIELRVWLLISSFTGGYLFSTGLASQTLGISRNTFMKAVESLERKGMVSVVRTGAAQKNKYAVTSPSKWKLDVQKKDSDCSKTEQSDCSKIEQSTPSQCSKIEQYNAQNVSNDCSKIEQYKKNILKDQVKDSPSIVPPKGVLTDTFNKDLFDKFRGEVYNSTIKQQQIMKANAIYDTAEFYSIAEAILCEWEAADTPAHEINWRHFVHVFRIKANEKRKANGTNQPKTREQQLAELQQGAERIVARAIAESAANMRQVQNPS